MPGFPLPKPKPAPKKAAPYTPATVPVYGKNQLGIRVVVKKAPVTSFTHGGVQRGPNTGPGGGGEFGPLPPAVPTHKQPVKIVVHPDGSVSAPPAGHMSAPAAPAAPAQLPIHLDAPAPGKQDPNGDRFHDSKKKPRVTATQVPGATPGMSDWDLAATRTKSLLDPIVQSITDAINQRTTRQQNSINGYTGELGRLFGLYNSQADPAFNANIASTSAVNTALADRLNGVTSGTGSDLTAQLAKIGADPETAARLTGDVAGAGKGASNTGYALGSVDLERMLGEKSASDTYGAKLPGLAGLYGLQETKQAQAQGSQDLADSLTQLEQTAPGLATSLLSQIQSNRNARDQLTFERQQFGAQTKDAKTKATTAANTVDNALSKTLGFLVNSQGDPVLKGGKIVEVATTSDQPKANASLSKALGYVVDGSGEPILRGGQKITLPNTSKIKPPNARQNALALGLARIGHKPGPNGEPPVTWQQYLTTGLSKGIPAQSLIDQGRKVYSQAEIQQGLIPGQAPTTTTAPPYSPVG